MTRRNIFIDDRIWERLKEYAVSRGLKVSDVIRRSIIEFLEREEK